VPSDAASSAHRPVSGPSLPPEPSGGPSIGARLRDALEIANTPFRHVQDILRFPISEFRMRSRLSAQLARGTPIVVYSATKTASTAVAAALERTSGIETVKVHHLQPEHFWPGPLASPIARDGMLRHRAIEQKATRSLLLATDRPLRVVSVMRDPIAFNLSNYTYFGRAYWMRSFWRSAPAMPTAQLMAHFLGTFPHESSSLWWTREFAATTGIDVLASGFDTTRGWQRYRNDRFDCLVLRADIDDGAKREALAEWLGREIAPVERENVNDTQSAPGVYERLKHAICDEPNYVDRMLALPSVRVFLDRGQRERLRARWLGTA